MKVKGKLSQAFPVSVSRRFYRGIGKGNGWSSDETEAKWAMHDDSLLSEGGQGFTECGGSDTAKFAELLKGKWPVERFHDLDHPV
jgi:hypothetical protein